MFTIWTVVGLTCLSVLMASLLFRVCAELRRESQAREGAEYVAAYNYTELAAAYEVACAALKLSYKDFQDMLSRRQARCEESHLMLSQVLSPHLVDPRYRISVDVYNRRTLDISDIKFDWEARRARKLELLLNTLVNDVVIHTDDIARKTRLPYSEVFTVLDITRGLMARQAAQRMAVVATARDEEAVL